MRWLVLLPLAAVCGAVEVWRRGLAAPLAYGARVWLSARPDSEMDVLA